MSDPSVPETSRPRKHPVAATLRDNAAPGPARFLWCFLLLVLIGLGAITGAHWLLAKQDLLAPPPLAATDCIDGKLAELRDAQLEDRTLLALGSSATLRNLDMPALQAALPASRAYNAAPCYLHIDQTAFLAEQLLPRLPEITTLLTVVAPRDFESCPAAARDFLDPALFSAFLDGTVPRWLPYVSGFRPLYLARAAAERAGQTVPLAEREAHDGLGSAVLRRPQSWRPPMEIDQDCFAGLTELEAAAARHGARLVVVTLPVMPEWRAENDPDGGRIAGWVAQMRQALRRGETLLIEGHALAWDDARFADPVHLIFPHHREFTRFIAAALRGTGGSAGGTGS
ncbi:hypothetical protein [Teichococcus vastitatis]|uniref:Uncharacterized protein n=1 Tax=Teichococcus vastitatis TaxID=2307076 RepID=A0ABS9W135_9PROT|nr:hypothetical protein [Pseudoroseomonas vastitatis]MCI0752620.1 hypothetical protein [Pseudoroseomonas vastitatis]